MSTITTRSGKGSPLTNNEVDTNFTNLNTDKLESADLAGYATLSGATFTGEVEATGFNGDLTGAILFKGQAGEALTKGDPVYISGISGNKTVVSKADANDANKMPCFGIVDATVAANADCSVVTFGTLQGLDTSSFSEGDELFISDTGTLTTTAPTGESSQIQKIGKVTRSHASTGSIKVMGAGRTNAVPNLNDGQFFLGNGSNQAVSTDFTTSVLGEISAGTGIGISGSGVISNSAPDQTVSLTGAGTTTVSGTYPNFTITGAGTTYTAGTGITLTGTEFSLTDTNAKLNVSDYTAADVLTKIKTVDGSGSGLDADTVDGIQASSFLRSDAVDTATGNMTFDGVVNLNNTVNFNPNGYQIVMDTDQTRKLFDFYRNGSLRMSLRHQTNQDDFNFDFTSGSNLKINDNRILTTADEGSGNGLDADTVDGFDASHFASQATLESYIKRSYADKHDAVNLAVGWYTIAQNTGNRAVARFAIWDVNSGDHQAAVFYAAHHYGTDSSNTITVLHNSRFSGSPFRYIRIKDAGTYDGAALQVYIDDASNEVNIAIVGDDVQSSGWDIVDFLPDATAPSNVSNWSSFTEKSKIDLDSIDQGGIATTGEIYAGGDLSQYKVWHAGNDGAGSGLDADNLDGVTWGSLDKDVGAVNFNVDAGNLNGLRFWNGSGSYRISMSASGASGAGRVSGETTSDYNMYFKMTGGTNRGFVFQSDTANRAGIDASGNIRTVANVDCNYLRADRIYANNDGSTGYFYNDSGTRVAYTGGDFYIQSGVGNYYNYATNQYLGNTSGDTIRFRGDTVIHNGWTVDSNGHFRMNDSKYFRLGSGSDVEHFWNGSNYYTDINGGAVWYIRDGNSSNASRFMMDVDNGNFHADGNIYAYSTSVSDEKLKKDITKVENALDKVSQLNGYEFTYLKDNKRSAGVIAQEVEKVLPQAVGEDELMHLDGDEEKYKYVEYDQLVALLIESIKELKAEVEELKGAK